MKSFLILIFFITIVAISFKSNKTDGINIYVSKEVCERSQIRMGADKRAAIAACNIIRRKK